MDKEEFMPIGKAARLVGVTTQTIRRWQKAGKIDEVRSPTNRRLYSFPCCSAAPRRMKNSRLCQVDRSPRQVLASALSNTLGRSHGEVDSSVVSRGRTIV